MLGAILNKSRRQHPTRHQLYGHLPPITKTIQVRRTRHTGHCWRSKDELITDVLLWTPHMAKQKQDDQLEHTYSSYVRIRDVTLKTCRKLWMIGRSDERGSGISVLASRLDDDDDDIYNSFNTLFGRKSCLVAPGVAVPPWATETVILPLAGGWWGQGIARALTRCMMKKEKKIGFVNKNQ